MYFFYAVSRRLATNVPRLHGVAAFGNSFFRNCKTNL